MTAVPYVLARTMGEAHSYARNDLGIEIGSYRIVNSPSTLSAVRGVDLHLVPGWENRFDRFAMKGAIRWTRMNVIDHSADDERGPLTDRVLEVAHRYNALRDQPSLATHEEFAETLLADDSNGDNMVSEGGPDAEKPVRRRRSRCKKCGALHFKDYNCQSNDPFPVE